MRITAGALSVAVPGIQTLEFIVHSNGSRGEAWLIFFASIAACAMGLRTGTWNTHKAPAAAGRSSLLPSPVFFLLFQLGPVILVSMIILNLSRPIGLDSLITAAGGFAVMLAWQLGLTVWLMKKARVFKPASAELTALVAEQSALLQIPVGRVFEAQLPMSNAFVFPWSRDMLFTTRISHILETAELKSIVAHELGHLQEPVRYRWGRLLASVEMMALGLVPSSIYSYGFLGLFLTFVVYLVLQRIRLILSQKAELAADRMAMPDDLQARIYARALEKIHEDNLIPAVTGRHETHPDLWSRMKQAGITPDYPKLDPPDKSLGLVCVVLGIGLLLMLNFLFRTMFQ